MPVTVRERLRRPDLAVTASADKGELSPGEPFGLAASGDVGDADASTTTLRYYRSADASITAGDAEVGTDAVAALAAGATSAESLTVNAPTAPGTYYYGACADAVAEETNTSNNCSAAVAVTVREPPRRPDLAVTASVGAKRSCRPGRRSSSDGDGGQPGRRMRRRRRCATTARRTRRSRRGRGGGHGCGGRAGGGGDQRRVTDGERADGAGHVLLRRVRGRGGGGDEHLEQLLGGGGGEGDGAAAAAGPGR